MLSASTQAYVAELLSTILIDIYHTKHAPKMKEEFLSAGFSEESLTSSVEQLFMMMITATYDRRPFSKLWGGYEYIWGMKAAENSIQARFKRSKLSNPSDVRCLSKSDIDTILTEERINDVSLDHAGVVDYSRTFLDIASVVDDIHDKMLHARSSSDVSDLHDALVQIHGIGDTIASKFIKYTLREIGVGNINPKEIPLSVAWNLTGEYHISEAIKKIYFIDRNVVPLAMGLLMMKGDPFAIDSLFYLNRFDPSSLKMFIDNCMRNFQ